MKKETAVKSEIGERGCHNVGGFANAVGVVSDVNDW